MNASENYGARSHIHLVPRVEKLKTIRDTTAAWFVFCAVGVTIQPTLMRERLAPGRDRIYVEGDETANTFERLTYQASAHSLAAGLKIAADENDRDTPIAATCRRETKRRLPTGLSPAQIRAALSTTDGKESNSHPEQKTRSLSAFRVGKTELERFLKKALPTWWHRIDSLPTVANAIDDQDQHLPAEIANPLAGTKAEQKVETPSTRHKRATP